MHIYFKYYIDNHNAINDFPCKPLCKFQKQLLLSVYSWIK